MSRLFAVPISVSFSVLVVLALSFVPRDPVAAELDGQLVLNPAAAFVLFDGERRPEDAEGFGLGIEYRSAGAWSVEAAAFKLDARDEFPSYDFTYGYDQYGINSLYYFRTEKALQPFALIGLHHVEFDKNKDDETQYHLGTGLRYQFNQRLSVRWDIRALNSLDDGLLDAMSTIGLSLAFGLPANDRSKANNNTKYADNAVPLDTDSDGVPDGVDLCGASAIGSPVNSEGCLDSDGDGIADKDDQCPGSSGVAKVDSRGCSLDSDHDGVADEYDRCAGTLENAVVDIYGCVGKTKTVEVERIRLNIQFSSGASELAPTSLQELAKVASFLASYADVRVRIEGHSDSQGPAEANLALSQRRAEAVRSALVNGFAIDPQRISAQGFGELKPVADNSTPSGRKKNRRVVAVITKDVLK